MHTMLRLFVSDTPGARHAAVHLPAGAMSRRRRSLAMITRRLVFAVVALCGASELSAQGTPVAAGSVSGIVFDSLAARPLAGAEVQLVDAENLSAPARTAISDSLGRYRVLNVPSGRYLVGFLHPMLDSIGIEPKPREVIVAGGAVRSDLGLPSPAQLRRVICGEGASADDALILGFVRRADDRMAVDSARVNAQWVEVLLERGSMTRSLAYRTVTTQETGWYAVCGAPSSGTVLLRATHAADSTEALEMEIPATGFLRRDLYFGRGQVAAADPSAAPADSLTLSLGVRRTGTGRLSGMVVGATGGEPLVGARVGVVNGSQTRTDASGRFTLTALPTGTRMLEVRAVGRYPLIIPVDVVEGAGPLRIAMATLQSVLDTVRITASRGNRVLMEFNQRKRSAGTGRFISSEDIQARNPIQLTDMFRMMPGVSIVRDRNGEEFLAMRGNASGQCRVSVFMNGMLLRELSANDINGFVQPRDVIGVEVYSATGAPAQYREQNGCGTVLIWSR